MSAAMMLGDRIRIRPRGWDISVVGTVVRVGESGNVPWTCTVGVWINEQGGGGLIWFTPSATDFLIVDRPGDPASRSLRVMNALVQIEEVLGNVGLEGWPCATA